MSEIVDWVKDYRKRNKLSQQKLAELLGWTHDKVSQMERASKPRLTIKEISQIGEKLGLSEEELANLLLGEAGLTARVATVDLPKTREEQRFQIEIHVAGTCLRKQGGRIEVLIGKRLPTRHLYPGKWECGGGQVRPGENLEEAVKRQLQEEFGVIVKVLDVIGIYEILVPDLDQVKIPGVRFLCQFKGYVNKRHVQVNPKEFSEYKWVTEFDIGRIDFIDGVREGIAKAMALYKVSENGGSRR